MGEKTADGLDRCFSNLIILRFGVTCSSAARGHCSIVQNTGPVIPWLVHVAGPLVGSHLTDELGLTLLDLRPVNFKRLSGTFRERLMVVGLRVGRADSDPQSPPLIQAAASLKNGRSIIVSSRLGPVEMMLAGMSSNSSSLRT